MEATNPFAAYKRLTESAKKSANQVAAAGITMETNDDGVVTINGVEEEFVDYAAKLLEFSDRQKV